jgi:hypothetical protein
MPLAIEERSISPGDVLVERLVVGSALAEIAAIPAGTSPARFGTSLTGAADASPSGLRSTGEAAGGGVAVSVGAVRAAQRLQPAKTSDADRNDTMACG